MKTSASVALLLLALQASSALAEEKGGSKALAPLPSWTGFYAGVNAGGLWNTGNAGAVDWGALAAPGGVKYPANFASFTQPGFSWAAGPAFTGGGQVGYNWQVSERVVVGVEADFQGVAGGANNWNTGWMSSASTNRTPNSNGSVRGRAGYLVTPNLQVYGTGGFAYSGGN